MMAILLFVSFGAVLTGVAAAEEDASPVASAGGMAALGAGLAIGIAGLGAGIGVGTSGAAAVAASAEKPEMFGKAIIFVALAEAVAIYGLLVAFLLYTKVP
ncbi:MAG: ATPase, F0/V0 complex, subunit C [Candidatus Syntrophoarchaeum caldarius]|uniref:ATPase, F0/V0 complex, subunit C n=1 Tax=Candidatus Syntropharchaeum caldarium TaxID=1838285 RepID=A0A1F2P961_9EURY|nr:MAG: ATPase, F0/V0 complex, subunit C [Candidatus Syntrophoarchaeum caldarius]